MINNFINYEEGVSIWLTHLYLCDNISYIRYRMRCRREDKDLWEHLQKYLQIREP